MTAKAADAGWLGLVGVSLVLASCGNEPEERCATVGRAGGLLYSADNVLTIAIQPEALDEDTEFCIVESKNAPEIYGNAYRVYPNPALHFAAAISYRFKLPDDIDEINIGRVDAQDYSENKGEFLSLTGCRVEEGARQVTCSDDEIAKFYGLLEDFDGPVSDSVADTSGDPTVGPTTNPSTTNTATNPVTDTNATDDPTDTNDTGEEDTGPPIVYPPECDDIQPGPFEPIEVGQVFEPLPPAPGGSQDMTSDGLGGFVARSGTGFARLDITGATYGVENDPGFVVQQIDTPAIFDYPSLNVRYRSNGDLIMMQGEEQLIEVLHAPHNGPIGEVLAEIDGVPGLANAAFVDLDDMLWYGSYTTGDIVRLDVDRRDDTYIANLPGVNGIVFDPLRSIAFFVDLDGPTGSLYRQRLSMGGDPVGDLEEVVVLEGFFDGMTLDACGNVYVVDQGGPHGPAAEARLHRVRMNDDGEVDDVELIFEELGADISHGVFAFGAEQFATSIFLVGADGLVFYVDVLLPGAPLPVLSDLPTVLPPDDGTTGG